MTGPSTHRQQVIDLRIRLERVAATAFDAVCAPPRTGVQDSIQKRLLFVVGLTEEAQRPRAHRLAHLGGHVYQRTSDVLHGRTSALDLTDVVVEEWRAIVEDLERALYP